jgi:hypothetical protein
MDGYPGSAAETADDAWADVAACTGSEIWNLMEIN